MYITKRLSLPKQAVPILVALSLISCGLSEQPVQSPPGTISESIEASVVPSAAPTADANTPTIPPTPTQALQAVVEQQFYFPGEWEEAEHLRKELLRTDLDPDTRQAYEEQLWIMDRAATLRATAQAELVAGATPRPTDTPGPTPLPLPRGVLDQPSGSFSYSDFVEQNMWRDEVDGYWWIAYAGAEGVDTSIGAIVVIKVRNHESVARGRIRTPGHTGSLRITAAQDGILTLRAEDGSIHMFDVRTFAWVP
jgi:hypothetical protein